MNIIKRAERALLRKLLPQPIAARHAEYSMIFSADDAISTPSDRLVDVALQAISEARVLKLDAVRARMPAPPFYPNVWPGETYRLLAGLVRVLKPARIVEVGTGGGTSALTMLQSTGPETHIVTFDILGWREWPGCLLRDEDFATGRLVQSTDDVSQPDGFAKHRAAFAEADFLFFDAAKDGQMEDRFLRLLKSVTFRTPPIVLFDDIRVWNMLKIWRELPFPKLDLTSFGHWTGSGLVEWPREGGR